MEIATSLLTNKLHSRAGEGGNSLTTFTSMAAWQAQVSFTTRSDAKLGAASSIIHVCYILQLPGYTSIVQSKYLTQEMMQALLLYEPSAPALRPCYCGFLAALLFFSHLKV
jgi:hypothetical protein